MTLSHVVFINAGDVKRQSHTWIGPGPDRDEGQQRAFQCRTPSLELVAFRLAFHKVTAFGQLRSRSWKRSPQCGAGARFPARVG